MRLAAVCALAALALAACAASPRPAAVQGPTHASSAELAAAIDRDAHQSERESDPKVRSELATAARRDADACIGMAPQDVGCLFGSGVALGLEARVHPTRAGAILNDMLATLARAETIDPSYEDAGPARVQALVLIRAPGWPLGPGDPERGLAAAMRAVALRPAYPPNWLAQGDAQAKLGSVSDARVSYGRARDAANKTPDTPDRADWLREAEQGLSHLQ